MSIKKFAIFMLTALLIIGLSACSAYDNRDLTRGYNTPDGLAPYTNDYNNRNGMDYNRFYRYGNDNYGYMDRNRTALNTNEEADRMASLAAKVSGVDDATVVIAGRTAYIALDIEDKVLDKDAAKVERNVYNKLKKYTNRYDINITTDAELFGRLRDIDMGIRNGTPVERYQRDLDGFRNARTPGAGDRTRTMYR